MRASACLVFAACYGGGYELEPTTVGSECVSLDCPIALRGELAARPIFSSCTVEREQASDARVVPPELAKVDVVDGELVFHAYTSGNGYVEVAVVGGGAFTRELSVAPLQTTRVRALADALTEPSVGIDSIDAVTLRIGPERPLAIFDGDRLGVIAEHRGATGERLLGHGFETWSITGAALAEPVTAELSHFEHADLALARLIATTGVGRVVVDAGGEPLELDVVAAGSTARLAVIDLRYGGSLATIALRLSSMDALLDVEAFTADGAFLSSGPRDLRVASANRSIASANLVGGRRGIRVIANARGTTTVSIEFDGARLELPVTVD